MDEAPSLSSINDHRTTLEHLEQTTTASSDAVTKLQSQVKSLSEVVSELTEKCIDLEGEERRSKRQYIRIGEWKAVKVLEN